MVAIDSFRPSMAATDVVNLASGTVAALLNTPGVPITYATVEAIRQTWFAWVISQEERGRTFAHWREAWWAWLDSMA